MFRAPRPDHRAVRRAALAAGLCAAALPATASAATYCVADQACVDGGGTAAASITAAMNAAAGTPAHDVLRIGEGTFEGAHYYGAPSGLEVIGAGRGKTILTRETVAPYARALSLKSPDGVASVRDLSVQMTLASGRGIELGEHAHATDVEVTGPSPNAMGVILSGGRFSGEVVLTGTGSIALSADAAGSEVVDAELTGPTGVRVNSTGLQRITRTRITATGDGVTVGSGAAELDSVVIDHRGTSGVGLFVGQGNAGAPAVEALATHLTITTAHPTPWAVNVTPMQGSQAALTLRDSALAATRSARRWVGSTVAPTSGSLTLDHVARSGQVLDESVDGAAGALADEHAVSGSAASWFADLVGGDLQLVAGSPLVDAGRGAGPEPGASGTDLAGNPRIADGDGDGVVRRDIGAYELPGAEVEEPWEPEQGGGEVNPAPGQPGTPGEPADSQGGAAGEGAPAGTSGTPQQAGEVAAADRTAPVLSGLRLTVPRRGKTTLRLTSSEPATLTLTLERRRGGRWRAVKGIAVTATVPSGASRTTIALKVRGKRLVPGRYRLLVRASDAAGNAASAAPARLTLRR